MSNVKYHPDIKNLVEDASHVEDPQLRSLSDVLQTELARRDTIKKGLDIEERLQFSTLIAYIRDRTNISEDDALAMIRAHVPK